MAASSVGPVAPLSGFPASFPRTPSRSSDNAPDLRSGALVSRAVSETEELGRGGRLRGGAAGELVAAAYAAESAHGPRLARGLSLADLAHAVALVEGGDLGRRRRAGARCAGCSSCTRSPATSSRGTRRSATPSTRARPSSSAASAAAAAGWLSAGRPRREAFRVGLRLTARTGARELHDALVDQAAALARHARATRDGARDRLHLPAAGAADDRRAPAAGVRLPRAPRRRPRARVARRARRERRRRRRQRRLALGARPRRASPSCSAARGSSSTRRTRPGRPTSTSSCSRRSRSRPRTRASSARTSRSTRARSSASSSSPTRTAARAR